MKRYLILFCKVRKLGKVWKVLKRFETRYSDWPVKPTSVQANAKISYQSSLGDGSTEASRLSAKITTIRRQYWGWTLRRLQGTSGLRQSYPCFACNIERNFFNDEYLALYWTLFRPLRIHAILSGLVSPFLDELYLYHCFVVDRHRRRSFDHCSASSFTRSRCVWRLEQRASTRPRPSYNCSEFDSFAIHSD